MKNWDAKVEFIQRELKKIKDMAWETNLNYAVIFWISPIGGTLEKRVVYSPSYNEVLDWLEHNRAVYENLEHAFYLNGAVK